MQNPKLKSLLKSTSLDAVLIASRANIAYLTDFFGFSQHERDAYILATNSKNYLFVNTLYANYFKDQKNISLVVLSSDNPFKKALKNIIGKQNIKSLGFEDTEITVKEYASIQNCGAELISCELNTLREIKTESEITKIAKACETADQALKKTLPKIKPGITEEHLSRLISDELRLLGSETSFPTIVAFSENAATPHHLSSQRKLKANDLILIDFGASYKNYLSDMTRTLFIGKPKKSELDAYQVVLDAQQKAADFIETKLKSNTKRINAKEVDQVARKYIISKGYPAIPHSLGHGIGLEVHEAPSLSPFSQETLSEGMVFSIEPGIYLPGEFGIRIEDLFAINGKELVKLTKSPKRILVL